MRIGGALAERGDQTGIIHGAMMIDVVGAKGRASEALEEIIFFVGSAIRTDEADRIGPVGVENLLQFCRGGFGSLFPGNGIEFVALADQGLLDAFGMLGEIEAEAAFYAKEIAVNAGEVAIVGPQDLVIAHAQRGLAAVGAVCADGGDVCHFPGSRFVAIGAAGERADRADVDAHAAFFALEMIFAIGNDHAVCTAHADAECFHVHAFVADAYAAETKNASRSVVIDKLRPFFFGAMNFFFDEAAGVGAVAEDHVLQFALAAFVADRAVERVVGQQKFQHVLAGLADLVAARFLRPCLRSRPACKRSATWAFFRLPPGTCGRPPATKVPGNSRTTELPCRCGVWLRLPAFPAELARRGR